MQPMALVALTPIAFLAASISVAVQEAAAFDLPTDSSEKVLMIGTGGSSSGLSEIYTLFGDGRLEWQISYSPRQILRAKEVTVSEGEMLRLVNLASAHGLLDSSQEDLNRHIWGARPPSPPSSDAPRTLFEVVVKNYRSGERSPMPRHFNRLLFHELPPGSDRSSAVPEIAGLRAILERFKDLVSPPLWQQGE